MRITERERDIVQIQFKKHNLKLQIFPAYSNTLYAYVDVWKWSLDDYKISRKEIIDMGNKTELLDRKWDEDF
jgi:hypothetical protein